MNPLRDPWLVAAWPGMGAVALLAAETLRTQLGAEPLAEVPAGEHFHPAGTVVREGLLLPPRAPATRLFGWRNPDAGGDLVVLVGEQQPTAASWRYCQACLDVAGEMDVRRVYTFAAMATTNPPGRPARVFAAATDAATLSEVRALGAEPIRSGEIGGMNGVFLAVAAERRLAGACLLGEIPFFSAGVSNPKAAAAVLRTFARLARLELDLGELERTGAEVDRQLVEHQEKLERAVQSIREATSQEWSAPRSDDELSTEDRARIEALFEQAAQDRSKALQLKAELDRLGVFARFEDRFLDLFKREA